MPWNLRIIQLLNDFWKLNNTIILVSNLAALRATQAKNLNIENDPKRPLNSPMISMFYCFIVFFLMFANSLRILLVLFFCFNSQKEEDSRKLANRIQFLSRDLRPNIFWSNGRLTRLSALIAPIVESAFEKPRNTNAPRGRAAFFVSFLPSLFRTEIF